MKNFITIIGAGPGISHSVAQRFGKEGFLVVLVARTAEKLSKQVADLQGDGVEAVYEVADVGNPNSLKNTLTKIKTSYGDARMILFNAAAFDLKDILEQSWETIKAQLEINAGAAFQLAQMVLPHYLEQNSGKLFFTGGGFALQGDPTWTSLSVGKAALRNIVQALAKRVENTNVHVAQLTICGFVNSGDPKYDAKAIAEVYWTLYNQKQGSFENEIIY